MKIEINEHDHALELTLLPETIEEMAQLLRYAKNAKAVKPDVFMVFNKEPYLYMFLEKKAKSVQSNSIKP